MLNKILFVSLFFLLALNSCFVVDQAINDKRNLSGNLSSKVKTAIQTYIKTEFKDQKYYKYGFSDLIIHKPIEFSKLDSLKNIIPKSNKHQNQLSKEISDLEQEIKKKKIAYWFEMDHVFNILSKDNEFIELYETTFYLNDTLGVTDVKPLMFLELTPDEEDIYAKFFYESPIFLKETHYVSQNLSTKFYTYFKTELNRRSGLKEKSDFVNHIIWICSEVKKYGEFDQVDVLKKLTLNYFFQDKQLQNYKPLQFSDLFEIKEDKILKNYYFFHKFSHSKNDSIVEDAVYVGFSPYYELTDVYQLEEPIEQFFNE